MLSIQYRFLFIHVPKTGGNSIQSVLEKYSEDRLVTPDKCHDGVERFEVSNADYPFEKHCPLWKYRKYLPNDLYPQLFRFGTVRNPWEMLISLYFSPNQNRTQWCRDTFVKLIDGAQRARWFLRDSIPGTKLENAQHTSMNSMPSYWSVDHVMRFENLQNDFDQVCKKIHITPETLPHRNRSNRNDYRTYYDRDLIGMVAAKFSDEIEFGDYQF